MFKRKKLLKNQIKIKKVAIENCVKNMGVKIGLYQSNNL